MADVDPGLLARITTLVDGHVESQIGATLALWRSIEEQGDRDLTGSTLDLNYEVAGFMEDLIALRFFSERTGGRIGRGQAPGHDLDGGFS